MDRNGMDHLFKFLGTVFFLFSSGLLSAAWFQLGKVQMSSMTCTQLSTTTISVSPNLLVSATLSPEAETRGKCGILGLGRSF